MGRKEVLDFGYVELVESWGSDEAIVAAARMSTAKGFQGWGPVECPECQGGSDAYYNGPVKRDAPCPKCNGNGEIPGDERLLAYLWSHKHATPFEMAGMVIEVKAPIMVFREWHRHRTQSYNEMSARYVPLPDENYVPTVERLMQSGGANKQAQGTGAELTPECADWFRGELAKSYRDAEALYQDALNMGMPKELARLCLPVGRYSRMRASANLRNWCSFLTLRMDAAAQYEIRVYANAVGELIEKLFPRTWGLFIGGKP